MTDREAELTAECYRLRQDRDAWRKRCLNRKDSPPPKPLQTDEIKAIVDREVKKATRYLRLRAEKAEGKAKLYADALFKATGSDLANESVSQASLNLPGDQLD